MRQKFPEDRHVRQEMRRNDGVRTLPTQAKILSVAIEGSRRERIGSKEKPVEDNAERKEIAPWIRAEGRSLNEFRWDVPERTRNLVIVDDVLIVWRNGQPKIDDRDVVAIIDHNIRGFEVSVDDVLPMEGAEGIEKLIQDEQADFKRRMAVEQDPLLQRHPRDMIHDQDIEAAMGYHGADGDDSVMVDPPRDAEFIKNLAMDEWRRALPVHDLQRHLISREFINAEIDRAGPTGTQE